ncbi:hypothetical protein IAW_05836 [Bacillus cereus str. Schrouff]|nr:hypothetical protein IAW_05836 [Bacillus cereus str. Schrouff]EOO81649.1 hypothetical protein IGY_05671 [Bacillus cereus K-5975c]
MMSHYYVSLRVDDDGNHKLHTDNCVYLPDIKNRIYLGFFLNCQDALLAATAKFMFRSFDDCCLCCNECHAS